MQRYSKNTVALQQKVESYIEKHQLLTKKEPIIVALSGGADSIALLHILLSLGYSCIAAHCNFHLRSDESNSDESFVRKHCISINIPLHIIDFDTVKHSKDNNISIEMAARDLRYEWFYQLLEKESAQAIAVAHHADDNIETLLMNLVRGSGLKGLTGMPVRNEKVVRPLLCSTRLEIENYLSENKLDYVTDSTNASLDYQRNKFRNAVIPLLEEINPSVRQTLYASLERFSDSFAIYESAIEAIKAKIIVEEQNLFKVNIALLKQQVGIATILYETLNQYGFNAPTVEQIIQNIDNESGKQFYSTSGYRLTKDRLYLIVDKPESPIDKLLISENDKEIAEPIQLKINRFTPSNAFVFSKDKNHVHLDASKLQFPLELRLWQAGDVFHPLGMTQTKKLSDFFIDVKLSRPEKEQTWVLLSGSEIVWIVGQRLDDRFKITDETTEILELLIH